MAENKTRQQAGSVNALVDAIPDTARRSDARALLALMSAGGGEGAEMWGASIDGFGSYHYVYESGREGDAPLIGFSPRKAATVLYLRLGLAGADAELAKFGKHTTGKGCLYIKRLADVDRTVLERILTTAVATVRTLHRPDKRRRG